VAEPRALGRVLALLPLAAAMLAWAVGGPAVPQDAAREAAGSVQAGSAYAWLEVFQANFPERLPDTLAHRRAIGFVSSSLHFAGASDVRVEVDEVEGVPCWNVIARIPGQTSARKVVLAAHHDVVPGAPGAIDDGGAIAAIYAATKALSAGPPPACDVELAIFDREEWGVLGARGHVGRAGAPIHAAVAVELVGWKQDRLVVHTIPYGFAWDAAGIAPSWLPDALQRAGRAAGIPLGIGDPKISPWYQGTVRVLKVRTGSDAGAYSAAGLPAAMLTGSALTNFYSEYHQPTDDLSQVDPARLDDTARVLAAAAHELGADPGGGDLGEAYLIIAEHKLGTLSLSLIGLLAALAAGLSALLALRRQERTSARALCALWLALVGFSLTTSVVGLLCFVPLTCALAAGRTCTPPFRVLLTAVGAIPFLVQALAFAAAVARFGFGWRAGVLETVSLLVAIPAAVLAAAALEGPKAATPTPAPSDEGESAQPLS
jgi:hypothetical protein